MYSFDLEHQGGADYKYTFNCNNGNRYIVLFAVAQDLFDFENNAEYQFYFLNIIPQIERPVFDINTSKTIAAITNDFFQYKPDGFVFYYPENTDGRDRQRTKLFDRWFENHSTDIHLRFVYVINIEDTVLYAGLLVLANNPKKDSGKQIVTNFIKGLNIGKDAPLY